MHASRHRRQTSRQSCRPCVTRCSKTISKIDSSSNRDARSRAAVGSSTVRGYRSCLASVSISRSALSVLLELYPQLFNFQTTATARIANEGWSNRPRRSRCLACPADKTVGLARWAVLSRSCGSVFLHECVPLEKNHVAKLCETQYSNGPFAKQ